MYSWELSGPLRRNMHSDMLPPQHIKSAIKMFALNSSELGLKPNDPKLFWTSWRIFIFPEQKFLSFFVQKIIIFFSKKPIQDIKWQSEWTIRSLGTAKRLTLQFICITNSNSISFSTSNHLNMYSTQYNWQRWIFIRKVTHRKKRRKSGLLPIYPPREFLKLMTFFLLAFLVLTLKICVGSDFCIQIYIIFQTFR